MDPRVIVPCVRVQFGRWMVAMTAKQQERAQCCELHALNWSTWKNFMIVIKESKPSKDMGKTQGHTTEAKIPSEYAI